MGRGGQGVERGGGAVGQACQGVGEQITENSLSFSFQSGIVGDSHLISKVKLGALLIGGCCRVSADDLPNIEAEMIKGLCLAP